MGNLIREGIPIAAVPGGSRARSKPSKVAIMAGREGVILYGLAFSAHNPFYEDENANYIPDSAELEAVGRLLTAEDGPELFVDAITAWERQKSDEPPLLQRIPFLTRGSNHHASDGDMVHGMPDSYIFSH
jgi:hypothetical protein